jgi:hypothetical protein
MGICEEDWPLAERILEYDEFTPPYKIIVNDESVTE